MTNIADAKEGLSLSEAARRLGVHYNTMRGWVLAGDVPVTRFGPNGHIVRIHPDDLEKLRQQSGGTKENTR
jgi:excisionase family DNA binding protein